MWISEQTVIIFLCSIKLLVFITEVECVYCAVQVESIKSAIGSNTKAFLTPLVFFADYAAEDRQQSVRKGVQRHRSREAGEKVSTAA
jgi:hypothetical protein